MRTLKTSTLLAALGALMAASLVALPASAQERISTPEADAFIAHPTHCAQWVGGPDYVADSLSAPLTNDFFKAVVSLNSPGFNLPIPPMDLLTSMCKDKLRSKTLEASTAQAVMQKAVVQK